jgi:signal transduction histidine kinase
VDLQLARKKSQNYLLLFTSLGLLLTTGIVYLGYRNFKKKDELKAIEINQLKYEQEAKVINAMLEGQENERNRIAIDLHDGLAGRLSASRMHMEKLLKNKDLKNKTALTDIANNLDNSLSELRNIARNLMPETLFKYGLKNAVEDYCASISQGRTDIKFVLLFYDSETTLSKNRFLTIYRIIQELINNAVKHAQATEVLVQYMVDKQKINITVEDNGIGFTNELSKDKGGMGLTNLKTRIAYLNGEIEFDSIPNEGTTVHIVINI